VNDQLANHSAPIPISKVKHPAFQIDPYPFAEREEFFADGERLWFLFRENG
jgi:hypothetical protein